MMKATAAAIAIFALLMSSADAQSRAFSSQLWKRFSLTKAGTQYVLSLLASSRSRSDSTLTNVPGTAR